MSFKIFFVFAMLLTPTFALAGRGDTLVHTQIFADVDAAPGQTFRVGVLFSIEPGWHIYWKNPGDSGLPTTLRFHLPPGYAVGPVQYPLPTKLSLPGDIINYAYEGNVMLFAYVTAPAKAANDLISVDASWLVCNEVCLPGKAALAMHPGDEHLNPKLFDEWSKRLPAHQDAEHVADLKLNSDPKAAMISVTWKNQAPKDIEFFPALTPGFEINSPTVETTGLQTTIHYNATTTESGVIPIDGVLEYSVADGRRLGLLVSDRH